MKAEKHFGRDRVVRAALMLVIGAREDEHFPELEVALAALGDEEPYRRDPEWAEKMIERWATAETDPPPIANEEAEVA